MDLPIRKYFLIMGKACNLQCIYCHQGSSKPVCDYDGIHPKKIAKYFPQKGNYDIVFYGGEPLLYYDQIIIVANEIKNRNPEARFNLITNGILLTVDKAKLFNELDIRIGVSHDGYFFEQTRRTKDFLKVNPEPYLTIKKRNISAVACRLNYNFYDIWGYFDEFQQLHGLEQKENVAIQVVKDVEGNTADELLINNMPEFEQMLDKVFYNLENSIRKHDFDCWEFRQYSPMIETLKWRMDNPDRPMGVWCGADTQVSHLDVYGNLYPCHNALKPNGHIDISGIKAGGYNPFVNDEKCINCPAYIYCGGGCPVSASKNREAMCYKIYHQVTRLLGMLNHLTGGI